MTGRGRADGAAVAPPARIVLVRPWTDAHAGGGCCSADPHHGVTLERTAASRGHVDPVAALVGEVYRRLRAAHPEADVQVVSPSNTAYLLPSTFRAVRRRSGVLTALREAARSTTAGAVLVDGVRLGDIEALGVDGVLRSVEDRLTGSR